MNYRFTLVSLTATARGQSSWACVVNSCRFIEAGLRAAAQLARPARPLEDDVVDEARLRLVRDVQTVRQVQALLLNSLNHLRTCE